MGDHTRAMPVVPALISSNGDAEVLTIAQKLGALRKRRQEFIDESARLFLTEYEKYRKDTSKNLA
jgi:hypothetical protein